MTTMTEPGLERLQAVIEKVPAGTRVELISMGRHLARWTVGVDSVALWEQLRLHPLDRIIAHYVCTVWLDGPDSAVTFFVNGFNASPCEGITGLPGLRLTRLA